MLNKSKILIIDDDEAIRDSCRQVLQREGNTVKTAKDGNEGLQIFKEEFFHLVFLDLKLPGLDGIKLLSLFKEENPATPVIIITGYASIDSAVEAMKLGAFHYLSKPFSPEELRLITNKALEKRKSYFETLSLRQELEAKLELEMEIGESRAMQKVMDIVKRVSPSDSTVLITGESGTGKELVAGAIHSQSLRKHLPFIVINCSAYPATLIETELFGHEKGAFTGAVRQKAGRFEQAHEGTVFLDEIAEIPPSAQIKLLRVLQSQKFERVGGERTLSVDVRILAATNKDLLQEVKDGNFREDLFYRINVIPIHLPPLRKRRNDIPLQARYFMGRFAAEQGKNIQEFSSEAMRRLLDYSWPGNVRELENSVEHAVVLAKGHRIEVAGLPSALHYPPSPAKTGSQGTILENEAKLLKEALDECGWNKKQAARRLGISRNTLYRKLRKFQIHPPTIH